MKISFEHGEHTTGLVFKKTYPKVTVTSILTETEKHLVHELGLISDIFFECVPVHAREDRDESIYYYRMTDVVRGDFEYVAENSIIAKEFQVLVTEQFKMLKRILDEGEKPTEGDSFEL